MKFDHQIRIAMVLGLSLVGGCATSRIDQRSELFVWPEQSEFKLAEDNTTEVGFDFVVPQRFGEKTATDILNSVTFSSGVSDHDKNQKCKEDFKDIKEKSSSAITPGNVGWSKTWTFLVSFKEGTAGQCILDMDVTYQYEGSEKNKKKVVSFNYAK